MAKDIMCFEINDWHEYPSCFDEWFDLESHKGKQWLIDLNKYAKENKLCIKVCVIDMAISLVITAHRDWVEKNCPELLEKKWENYCVYKYPWPYQNDCDYYPDEPSKDESERKENEDRQRELYFFHKQFTAEEIENFKPHNICGSPSGEPFYDWEEENFGAREFDEDGNVVRDPDTKETYDED